MSQVFTGARGRVEINGATVGFVGGINVTIEDTLTDVDVLGQLEVGDLAETAHKCNFSINYFKVAPDAGVAAGAPQASSNTAAALGFDKSTDASVLPMISQGYFSVIIYDDNDDSADSVAVFKMLECKFEGGTGQVDARGLWQGTWNFRAKRGFGL